MLLRAVTCEFQIHHGLNRCASESLYFKTAKKKKNEKKKIKKNFKKKEKKMEIIRDGKKIKRLKKHLKVNRL